ncbi:MAG: c-type cytochrome [Alteraurantiacibacter sp.]
MNDRMNTIFGWVLASLGVALGGSIVAGKVFDPHEEEMEMLAENPGYAIEAPEEGEGGASGPSLAQLLAAGDAGAGEAVFAKCQSCHTIAQGGPAGIGPNLYGVLGQPIAGKGGFSYSSALSGKGESWTYENMDAWLASPRGFANGTSMSFAGLGSAEDRANVILYLRANGGGPDLPTPEAAPEGEDGETTDAPGEGPGAVAGEEPDAAEAAGAMGDEQPVAENPGT